LKHFQNILSRSLSAFFFVWCWFSLTITIFVGSTARTIPRLGCQSRIHFTKQEFINWTKTKAALTKKIWPKVWIGISGRKVFYGVTEVVVGSLLAQLTRSWSLQMGRVKLAGKSPFSVVPSFWPISQPSSCKLAIKNWTQYRQEVRRSAFGAERETSACKARGEFIFGFRST